LHYTTEANSGEGTEELKKVPIRECIVERISLKKGGEDWMDSGSWGFGLRGFMRDWETPRAGGWPRVLLEQL